MGRKLTPFWENVQRGEDCWEWQGARNLLGYGRRSIGNRRYTMAHRVAWTLANGPIPAGMLVLHTCDNPPCVRPDHLRLGTQADNIADCIAKGRFARGERHSSRTRRECRPRGERHPHATTTEETVRKIRELHATGVSFVAIAQLTGVSHCNAWLIGTRKTWTHI